MVIAQRPFRRVLVANRGEIAVRIIRACHELGMEAVAVYSDADRGAGHVRAADLAVRLGPAPAAESYLRIDALLEAARRSGCEAVHPGYGFLAERAEFAAAVASAGLVFVGPRPTTIETLGDKLHARRLAAATGVPVAPGTLEPVPLEGDEVLAAARRVGFPLLVKAAAGGGGRGMRRVASEEELEPILALAAEEARSAFGRGTIYLEKDLRPARHIEVQLLGDEDGTVVALGERDCSIQRRHQKLVEEAPAPGLTAEERRRLHGWAVALARAAGLTNAATAEFLRTDDGAFWFLEVNTRLQVEHPVTELVSGVDIVQEQFWLAAGRPLSEGVLAAAERADRPAGHAIEVRITAEDPGRAFAPQWGRVTRWRMPAGPGVRVETALAEGDRIPPEYDNLLAKIVVWGADRPAALARLRRALDETEIGGIQTTLPFHRFVAGDPVFAAGGVSTDYVTERWSGERERDRWARWAAVAAGLAAAEEVRSAGWSSGLPAWEGGRAEKEGQAPHGGGGRWRMAGRLELTGSGPWR
jgi:acetyl-CoA carboxylase biotin carboxylase subunit